MKEILFSLLFLSISCITVNCCFEPAFYEDSSGKTIITKRKAYGVIFKDTDYAPIPEEALTKRFVPSVKEVFIAERILKKQFLLSPLKMAPESRKFVLQNIDKYMRQYVGYINREGEKEILINLVWNPFNEENLSFLEVENEIHHYWYEEQDGGLYFWKSVVNIKQKKLHSIEFNGDA